MFYFDYVFFLPVGIFKNHNTLWNNYKQIDNRHTTIALHLNARRIIITPARWNED